MRPRGVKQDRRGGFTLVEIMVAAVISSILLLLLVQVLVSTQDLWINLRKKTDAAQETRALMSLMQSDLRAMFTRGDRKRGVVPFYLIPGQPGSPTEISFLAVQELLAQDPSSQSAAPPKSDLCIISYRLDTTSPERPLLRTFSDSNATYQALKTRVDAFIDPLEPDADPQTPTLPESADVPWRDASTGGATASGTPDAITESLGMRVMAFQVVPFRLRRPVASPTGLPMVPHQLQNILTGRIAGTATAPWPQPHTFPEHVGPLPGAAPYDPDYAAPDVIELRLVVADSMRVINLDPAQMALLGNQVQNDINDGQLDGMADGARVLSGRELKGLSYATTTVAIGKP